MTEHEARRRVGRLFAVRGGGGALLGMEVEVEVERKGL